MAKDTLTTTTPAAVEVRLHQTIASQALENLGTPPEEEAMLRRLSRGEISPSEYQEWAENIYLR